MEAKIFQQAADLIKKAKALIITAGAGMGVDSGLPDFRGEQGFWKAYPPYQKLKMSFSDAANPAHFQEDASLAWGFYGHRLNMYRNVTPHKGFYLLQEWIQRFGLEHFIVTSNVDGQFQKAGFDSDSVNEIHGSIHYLQCIKPCKRAIWDNKETVVVNEETMRAENLPKCVYCNQLARPNILMFGDWHWLSDRSEHQEKLYGKFLDKIDGKSLVIIELGAGKAIASIRTLSERLCRNKNAFLIRINPRDFEVPSGQIGVSAGALEGLEGIEKYL